MATPHDVNEFWANAGPAKWWKKDADFDAKILDRFGETLSQAAAGKLGQWTSTPDDTLALILVLDQFSRNLYRNDAKAYAQDAACQAIVKTAISVGDDRKMRTDIGSFCYLPLMHSENLEDQKSCVAEFERLNLEDNLKSAIEHLEIIEKFGRFPHRNPVLGRTTTAKEQIFLESGGFSG